MNHIQPMFKQFADSALPEILTADQIEFAEIAFYAGSASIFAILMDKIESGANKKDGGKFLFELEQELIRFMGESVQTDK